MKPILYIVVPCYNEEKVLPQTNSVFATKINDLVLEGKISEKSRVLFVNDGSIDTTWEIITDLSKQYDVFEGISLSRNRGHQNALLAGLDEARKYADITISIDCDGQDDINAIDEMVEEYLKGSDIVYGVRKDRKSDTAFKRITAQGFYKFLNLMGAEVVYNHADYRLMSKRALDEFFKFEEVNIYIRGMVPLVGFKSSIVYYDRSPRLAGKSHYPLRKMLSLAFNGITSLSVKPIRIITTFGVCVSLISFLLIIWSIITYFTGSAVSGWASLLSVISFFGGIQLISLGVIGEYIGKIYTEVKRRPRYIIETKTYEE